MPNGALRVDALVTTSGVFLYHDSAGRPVREYRPPEEVQNTDSISTLRDMAVTVLHPPALVDPKNWDSYAVGHVSGEPVKKGDGVLASLVISQQDAIDLIDSKKVQEISCGYQVMLEDSPGTTPAGEKYDSIQRNIRYNHVAMGPPGWGRQGSAVSLRLDSAGNQIEEHKERRTMDLTIVFDGQTYTVKAGSQEHNDLLRRIANKDSEVKAKLDAAADLQKRLDTVTGERDVLQKQLTETKTKLDAAPAAAVAAAKSRLQLEDSATKVLGDDFKCDGKEDKDIQVAMIQKFDPDFKADGLSADYIKAACDTHTKRGSADRQDQMVLDQANIETRSGKLRDRTDEKDPLDPNDPDPELARTRARKDSRRQGMGSLGVTADKPHRMQGS